MMHRIFIIGSTGGRVGQRAEYLIQVIHDVSCHLVMLCYVYKDIVESSLIDMSTSNQRQDRISRLFIALPKRMLRIVRRKGRRAAANRDHHEHIQEDRKIEGDVKDTPLSDVATLHRLGLLDDSLGRAQLINADLQGADLSGRNLAGANLGGANLRRANLAGANLQDADFWMANLQEANLSLANCEGAKFYDTDLQGANLSRTNLRAAMISGNLRHADLTSAILYRADLRFSCFEEADFTGANLREAAMAEANLQGADLMNADLQGAILPAANLRMARHIETAILDGRTILPNGKRWKAGDDLTRFTNPQHPDFPGRSLREGRHDFYPLKHRSPLLRDIENDFDTL